MYDRNMKLLSDNVFASDGYIDEFMKVYPTKNWVWASANVKKYGEEIYNNYKE